MRSKFDSSLERIYEFSKPENKPEKEYLMEKLWDSSPYVPGLILVYLEPEGYI